MSAFRDMLYSTLAHDTPLVLLYELAGWEIQPQFACELAALREAVRLHCREPSWIEEASVRFAARRWPDLLPTTVTVLSSLGWTRGSYILRRDSYGQERRFELGVDSFEILAEWLRDVFRRRFLSKCGRVVQEMPVMRLRAFPFLVLLRVVLRSLRAISGPGSGRRTL